MTRRINSLNQVASQQSAQAEALMATGRCLDAERLLTNALSQHPQLVRLRGLLAEALIRQGKDSQALPYLLETQNGQRIWSEGNAVRIALLRARLGRTKESRADWNPEIVMRYCGGLPEARASLPSVTTAKGLETAWSLAAGYLADLHADDAGSAYYYGRALALDPNNAFVNLKMGDLELRKGRAASAVARYALAARGTGRLRAEALRQGETAKAMADAAKAPPAGARRGGG